MGYASQSGRARTSSRNPQAHGICDRCGFRYNHVDLKWQFDWAGASLINKRLLVCNPCNDQPQQQLRAIIVPADPMPIINPRIQDFVTAETNNRYTSSQILVPSAASGTGTTVTLTFSVPLSLAPITVGSTILVSGVEPIGYNGTHIVTASSNSGAYTVSYLSRSTGDLLTKGQVAINIDPVTGLAKGNTQNRITQNDKNRVTQMTGEPPFGLNQEPGTSISVPDDIGGNDPGLPYNMDVVPKTGPLT
jgi:hypothetical protein